MNQLMNEIQKEVFRKYGVILNSYTFVSYMDEIMNNLDIKNIFILEDGRKLYSDDWER